MPRYDYKCNKCEYIFEVNQSIKDDPLTFCSECDGLVYRLISKNVGLSFKGAGFYVTDVKNKAQNNTKLADSPK